MAITNRASGSGVNSRLEGFCDDVFAFALTMLAVNLVTPSAGDARTTADFWQAMARLAPALLCFLLSFLIILTTWNGHHSTMKLVEKSSPKFIRANALLLLTIVLLPFATNLMAEFLFTDTANSAVFVFSLLTLLSSIAWMHFYSAARSLAYPDSRRAIEALLRQSRTGFLLYLACTVTALWQPLVAAGAQVIIWFLWLFHDRVVDKQAGLEG